MKRLLVALLPVFAFGCFGMHPAFAEDNALPGEANWQVVRFPGGANAVTVNVYEAGGATVATAQAASQRAGTDLWELNLAAVSGYPTTCSSKSYVLQWDPDAVDCGANPTECVETTANVGGAICRLDPHRQVSSTFARDTVDAQGISSWILKAYHRIGQEPLKWQRIDVAADGDYSSPSYTSWDVYFYTNSGPFPHIECIVNTTTDPSVTLPSSADCSGN